MQRFVLFLIGFGLLFVSHAVADEVKMYLDYAQFRYDESNNYLELYYMVHDKRDDAEDIWLQLMLTDVENDSVVKTHTMRVKKDTHASGDQFSSTRGGLIQLIIPFGEFQFRMLRMDEPDSTPVDSLTEAFAVSPFSSERIGISDIEICSNIITNSTNTEGVFYKNTMEVFPNPPRMYSKENPQLYYYSEMYNISNRPGSGDIKIQVAIKDGDGSIYESKEYTRSRQHESLVEFGRFNVSGLPNGVYTLMVAAVDENSEYSVYQIKDFYIVNQSEASVGVGDPMALFPSSMYYSMPLEQVDLRFRQAEYIALPDEIKVYRQLVDVSDKRLYLFKFWMKRERSTPGISTVYYDRVAYSNEVYRFANKQGWESDMGRIYILYGEPDEIIRKPLEMDSEPFEVWFYHELEGGGRFLFIDYSGFKNYRMMSSTLRGELYDPTYDQYLFVRDN